MVQIYPYYKLVHVSPSMLLYGKVGLVCIRAKRPIRLELNLVSVA